MRRKIKTTERTKQFYSAHITFDTCQRNVILCQFYMFFTLIVIRRCLKTLEFLRRSFSVV